MRFGELRGLTSLPIHRLRDQFRYEDVLTVLPVRDAATSSESLFVATRAVLAILTTVRVPRGHWMTRWAPWGSVQIVDQSGPPGPDDDVYRLRVLVGGQMFHAQLTGETGRLALRDFVIAVRSSRSTNVAPR